MLAASLVNLLATATITASSAQAGYPVSFLAADATPDIPWKTTATGEQWALIDNGSAKAFDQLTALYTNYESLIWQAHTANVWTPGTPTYNPTAIPVTVGKNPGNSRLCRVERPPATLTLRWVKLTIPAQATTDGAAYYRTGAAHVSPLALFRNFAWQYRLRRSQKTEAVETLGGGGDENILGPARMHLTGTLKPMIGRKLDETAATILLNDQVFDLIEFAQQWKDAGKALVAFGAEHAYWVAMMRIVGEIDTQIGYPVAEWNFEWLERS